MAVVHASVETVLRAQGGEVLDFWCRGRVRSLSAVLVEPIHANGEGLGICFLLSPPPHIAAGARPPPPTHAESSTTVVRGNVGLPPFVTWELRE